MKVYTLMLAEYDWDIHDIEGVYSSQEKAEKAEVELRVRLLQEGRHENKTSIYIDDWEVQ